MKFAIADGNKAEAKPGLIGQCPSCGSELIPRCGNIKIHHWAHKSVKICDNWWENETQWHRDWKNHFPVEWQEVVQTAEDGEKHIADVKTSEGWVVEFQHSYLKHEERVSRDRFYGPKLVWVVDGNGTRNIKQFQKIIGTKEIANLESSELIAKDNLLEKSNLIEAWSNLSGHVIFDFGNSEITNLWILISCSEYWTYLLPISRKKIIGYLKENIEELDSIIEEYRLDIIKRQNKEAASKRRRKKEEERIFMNYKLGHSKFRKW